MISLAKTIDVELRNVQKRFDDHVVVNRFNLQIEKGECISFLGPSGCGKTTTLNMIAGFLEPDEGEIYIKGTKMNGVPPNKRDLGMVFQTYSLFPHMTVAENISYGLKLRKIAKKEINERVQKVLQLVRLPHVGDRYPKQLSGGQRQRIAIARALVVEPSLLLLDEPLSNLDAKLREELREEIRRLHQQIGVTTIFVTHDQEEALYLSDRIVVLDHGKIEQIGTPWDIYNRPASTFVHTFIGKTNRLTGKIEQVTAERVTICMADGSTVCAEGAATAERTTSFPRIAPGTEVNFYVRPENIQISATADGGSDALDSQTGARAATGSGAFNSVRGRLRLMSFLGSYMQCDVQVGEQTVFVKLPMSERPPNLTQGQAVYLQWHPQSVFILPEEVRE